MKWYLLRRIFSGCACILSLTGLAHAAPSNSSWEGWFQHQISQHPEIVAARENMNAQHSLAEGGDQPLYNPELETEFEREGEDDNYRIGIRQTIDWWDKRGTRHQQSGYSRVVAQQTYALSLQEKAAEALRALVEWQFAKQQADLARKQEEQLEILLKLIRQRQQAGDLGQIDAELAFLNMSQVLNDTAQAQVQLKQIEFRSRELLPDWSVERSLIPERLWSAGSASRSEKWVDLHPAVIAAHAEWERVQQTAELARLDSRADPTFGIDAGKTGKEDVVALTFSIPLNVRNNFSAETRAASQEALAAEANYMAIRRKQQLSIKASQAVLQEYQQRYQRWKSLMQGRGERSADLLNKQWSSGDLSITEYLLVLQQRSEGLIAGYELHEQFQLAHIDWLLQTGQINAVLAQSEKTQIQEQ